MIKKPLKEIFKNHNKVADNLSLNTNLRPENLDPITFFKITKEYEKLKS